MHLLCPSTQPLTANLNFTSLLLNCLFYEKVINYLFILKGIGEQIISKMLIFKISKLDTRDAQVSNAPLHVIIICAHDWRHLIYHPMINFLKYLNWDNANGLVKISACCILVSMGLISIFPLSTQALKWWYLIAICFVLGLILGTFASSSAPLLSLNTLQCIIGLFIAMLKTSETSSINPLSGIASLKAVDKAIYSLSHADNAISDCRRPTHNIGQFACLITHPVFDKMLSGFSVFPLL